MQIDVLFVISSCYLYIYVWNEHVENFFYTTSLNERVLVRNKKVKDIDSELYIYFDKE